MARASRYPLIASRSTWIESPASGRWHKLWRWGGNGMAAHIDQVPAWWLGMAKTRDARQLLALLDEVKRLGISRNDRRGVERIWRQMQIDRELRDIAATL
jgi:hypothetical protein